MKYIIAIDIGTQGTKACLFDAHLQLCANAFVASRLISPDTNTIWQEVEVSTIP